MNNLKTSCPEVSIKTNLQQNIVFHFGWAAAVAAAAAAGAAAAAAVAAALDWIPRAATYSLHCGVKLPCPWSGAEHAQQGLGVAV